MTSMDTIYWLYLSNIT